MAAGKGGARKSPTRPAKAKASAEPKVALPVITVGKFEDIGALLERVVAENQAAFIAKGQEFKEQHRAGSSRPLTAVEAAQAAIVFTEDPDPVGRAQEIQESFRAYDEPDVREVLLAAGLGTARAVVEAFRSVVALIEMPVDDYEDAHESGALTATLADRAATLRKLPLVDGRRRTTAAMEHFAASAGFSSGEAWGLPVKALRQALATVASQLVDASQSSQLIGSPASTAGPDETSAG